MGKIVAGENLNTWFSQLGTVSWVSLDEGVFSKQGRLENCIKPAKSDSWKKDLNNEYVRKINVFF